MHRGMYVSDANAIKKATKLFSRDNDMDPGTVPHELQNLTEIEEMLIARACTIMCVDIQGFLRRLPPNVTELPFLMIRRYGADNTHKDCRVRSQKVMQAITWLKKNNPYYSDIVIDEEALQRLPDDGVPDNLPSLDVEEN